jgi:mRNA interferase RelE/StbE
MNPPVFRGRASATLEGEIICYRSVAVAQGLLLESWRPALTPHFMPGEDVPGKPSSTPSSPAVKPSTYPDFPAQGKPRESVRPKVYNSEESVLQASPRADQWLIGFAKPFRKAVDSIDRKLQGRILEAVTDIASTPVLVRGDTVKPLGGEMAGYWRYRIGDFRLVYYPDAATRTVTLYDFASRGTIYD